MSDARAQATRAACAAITKTPSTSTRERGIFLVVDGIGGQAAGEKAAEIAVERVRARLERQTGTAEQRIREAITMANNEILRAARANPGMAGHGVRADPGGAGERLGGDRPRGRFAPLPDPRRRDPQDHARPFARGRARGQPRAERSGGHAPPAPQRSVSRRGLRRALRPTTPISSRCSASPSSRMRPAAVQRRAERPGGLGRDPRAPWRRNAGDPRGRRARTDRRRPTAPAARTTSRSLVVEGEQFTAPASTDAGRTGVAGPLVSRGALFVYGLVAGRPAICLVLPGDCGSPPRW